MPIRNLQFLLAPQSVAVIGAGPRAGSVGRTVWNNLRGNGRTRAYPVNPKYQALDDRPCFASVAQLPEVVDCAVLCIPAAATPAAVRECGERGVRALVILSAGYREVGAEGLAIENQLRTELAKFPGLRVLGPNCLGFIAPHLGLNLSFADASPAVGSVAFISQSGALCSAVLDWSTRANVGFSYFISLGNMLDVDLADLLDFTANDPYTESTVLYIESITEARRFMSAARAFTRRKPIIAYKAGRFSESAQAAASHTGALAGEDHVYEAAFARGGIVRVYDMEDLAVSAELLARRPPWRGERLAILTNAGGPGVMATDSLIGRRGKLAKLSPATIDHFNQSLPPFWSHGNPVDILGDAPPERYRDATATLLKDGEVDALLAVLSPQAMTDPTAAAQAVADAAKRATKPVLAAWMGGNRVSGGTDVLRAAGIPNYPWPENAIRAFSYLTEHAKRQETLYETPREIPAEMKPDRAAIRAILKGSAEDGRDLLSEGESKQILAAYGIQVTPTHAEATPESAVRRARQLGYPVVLKLDSPDITHKSDAGGVELNLLNDEEVTQAFDRITARARQFKPDARVRGVTVQPMVTHPFGRELIVGAKRDPVFGMVMLVGSGGTEAELLQDRALELPPLSERLARRMLESLRLWPLLKGYRGKPGVHLDKLIETLIRLSYLVADRPEIVEFDVNPLVATPTDALALDARMVIDRGAVDNSPAPYSHLAIRPYPEEFERTMTLKDGESVWLRPIRPEDEGLWKAMIEACSLESIRRRFRYLFKEPTHAMAARYCFIDYDRELAIVAERRIGNERRMLGVGRMISNADRTEAEFAVLVADAWQGVGLGAVLTDYCLGICDRWGVRKIVAETAADNHRMVEMFRRRGFEAKYLPPDTVVVVKEM